jgi:hypothetical protein
MDIMQLEILQIKHLDRASRTKCASGKPKGLYLGLAYVISGMVGKISDHMMGFDSMRIEGARDRVNGCRAYICTALFSSSTHHHLLLLTGYSCLCLRVCAQAISVGGGLTFLFPFRLVYDDAIHEDGWLQRKSGEARRVGWPHRRRRLT